MRYQDFISETEERHTLVKQLMVEQLLENQLMMERLTEQINQLKKENMQLKQRSHKGNVMIFV
jgi:tRNA(Phe) wybutosine-synthesizing methylase Tyw3